MKPIATVPRALATVDVATGEAAKAHHQRSDVCAVPAAGIVAEAMVALVLADAVAEKFGGDCVAETRRNVRSYLDNLADPVSGRRWSSSSAPWASASPPSGELLAERLGVAYRDTDADIVAAAGPRDRGDLRRRGRAALPRPGDARPCGTALAGHDGVLALGGGAVLDEDTRRCWPGSRVVYLSMDVEEAVQRVGLDAARPLLAVNPRRQWRELMEARRPLYDRGRPRRRRHRRPHPRRGRPGGPRRTGAEGTHEQTEAVTRIQVGGTAGTEPYEVLVGRQLLGELPGLIGDRAKRVAVHPPRGARRDR